MMTFGEAFEKTLEKERGAGTKECPCYQVVEEMKLAINPSRLILILTTADIGLFIEMIAHSFLAGKLVGAQEAEVAQLERLAEKEREGD